MKTVMVQGTASSVGKSILVTGLCRIFARKGYKVAPFKAQNMALNSFATPEGAEIGRAQAVQAQAAMIDPHTDMNPILLKPEADSRSQVVVMGKPWKTLKAKEYYTVRETLWRYVSDALERLGSRYDIIIIEGAGSPAEINLKKDEIVNMRVARHLGSPVLLVGDIDRGGVFASLYGTYALLTPEEKQLIKGFVMNKFRGDKSLLFSGLQMLADLTDGVPTLGVVPMLKDLYIAQEDSVFLDTNRTLGEGGQIDIVVVRFPHLSNYDDFDPLAREPGVRIRFVENPREVGKPDAVILPGTKTTIADLLWSRERGWADVIGSSAAAGMPVVGICGGYQMMGGEITDPHGTEPNHGSIEGLGLLDVTTWFRPVKTTLQRTRTVTTETGFFSNLTGTSVTGYEIHMGECSYGPTAESIFGSDNQEQDTAVAALSTSPDDRVGQTTMDGAVTSNGKVWGCYLHGLFDNPSLRRGWLISLGWAPNPADSEDEAALSATEDLREREFDRLADHLEKHLDMERITKIMEL